MPTVIEIENADPLSASQAQRLLAAIRMSEKFRDNRSAYPDLDAKVKGRVNRKKTITAASNASPIVITSNAHGFSDNEVVTVQGLLGNTAANGTWIVNDKTDNTFELQGSTGNGAYTSGGEVLDLVSQHLSVIADALKDGTVAVKGGRDGTDFSQVRDREALVAEALDALYDVVDAGAVVVVGQRGACVCNVCGLPIIGNQCWNYGGCTSMYLYG